MSAFHALVSIIAFGIQSLSAGVLSADAPMSQSFDAKGVRIHYLTAGKGQPVVLIHGLYSTADLNWKRMGVLGELAKSHQVIALDLPGHGASDKPQKEEAYGLQVVDDVVLLLDHLKIKKAHIVGYSLGGMITVKLMVRHPNRVLSGTVGGMGWFREGSAWQKMWEQLGARQGGQTPAAFVKSVGKLAVTAEELKKIEVPVKILIGDQDPTKRSVVALQQVRKDWPVVVIEGAGHITCVLKPQFREEIAHWVRKNTSK